MGYIDDQVDVFLFEQKSYCLNSLNVPTNTFQVCLQLCSVSLTCLLNKLRPFLSPRSSIFIPLMKVQNGGEKNKKGTFSHIFKLALLYVVESRSLNPHRFSLHLKKKKNQCLLCREALERKCACPSRRAKIDMCLIYSPPSVWSPLPPLMTKLSHNRPLSRSNKMTGQTLNRV